MPIIPMVTKMRDILTGPCECTACSSNLLFRRSHVPRWSSRAALALFAAACRLCGCTSLPQWIHNGFKVGPNYKTPPAPVANDWIDASDKRVRTESDDHTQWWTNFNDPVLDDLVCDAYKQNLTLKEAGMRILQARAQLGIAVGGLFPQTQQFNADYTRTSFSKRKRQRPHLPQRATPASSISASTWPGKSISGASIAAPSNRPAPISTPQCTTTTTCWSRC